jgi:hypothetical protein
MYSVLCIIYNIYNLYEIFFLMYHRYKFIFKTNVNINTVTQINIIVVQLNNIL